MSEQMKFEDSSRLSVRLNWLEKKSWKNCRLCIATVCVVVAFMYVCVLPMAAAKEKDKEVSSGDKTESRAWHVMRQWNAGPLLLGLTQRLGKAIVPSRRDGKIWKGVKKGGKLKLKIMVEGDASGEIFVGFFSDARWSGEPVQVRSFPRPGEYVVEKLPVGKYQIGVMIGTPPVADALGVQQMWPEPIEVKRGKTAAAKVLVSPDFQQRASGVDNKEAARAFVGEWDKMNRDNLLQGRVRGPDGKPIAYAQIVLHEYKTKRASYRMLHSGTDGEGQFYLDKMNWPYRIQVIWDEKLPEALGTRQHYIFRRRVFKGRQTVNFKFDDFSRGPAVLKGRVIDQDDKPVGEFHLFVATKIDWSDWHKDADGDYRATQYRIPFVSEDGRFELSGLPSGVFEARAIPFNVEAYEFHQGIEVKLKEGATTESEVKLRAKKALHGRVLFKDGKTPAVDEIRIVLTMGGGRGRVVGSVDSDGYFTVHFNDRELEAVKAGWSTILMMRKDSRQRLGTFPAKLLSSERNKAGTLKVPRIPPKETKELGTGDPSKSERYGKKVEPFELLGIDGKTYRLADYKGKVVLLNIFATWCGPCKVELPHLRELNSQFADKGLVILAISHREKPAVVESYAREHNLPYPALVDRRGQATNQFADKWGRISLPTNVLLDRDHKIAYYGAGFGIMTFDEIRETVKKLLAKPSATSDASGEGKRGR
jgi:peroxiredoxin